MITKTYLDGKLNQLEEKMKRTIDVKDNRQTEELRAEIKELRNAVKSLEEKVAGNRDMVENYLKERKGVVDDNLEELKESAKSFQEAKDKEGEEEKNKNDDVITSDF